MKQSYLVTTTRVCALSVSLYGIAAIGAAASADNLVDNGDFANAANVFKSNTPQGGDDIQTSGGTKIPGWTNVAKFVNELWVGPTNSYNLTSSSKNGSGYFLDLTGQANAKPYGGIEQKIATTPGMGYTLTFDLGASTLYNSSGAGEAALTASATGSSVLVSKLFSLSPTSSNEWKTESLTFIADSNSTTIEFLADSNNTSQYTGLDNVVMENRLLATTTSLTASPTSAVSGSSISLTALVKPSEGSVTPSGKVEFKSGSTVLGSASLNGAGQATYNTSKLAVGKDSLTAVYLADSIYSTSTSKAVTVTITAASAGLSVSPTSLAFGNEATATTSAAKTVTIKNSGTATISFSSIKLTGGQADDFALSKTCGSSLAANASCTLSVTFKPVSTGAKAASISIADNASNSPQTVALSGTGTTATAMPTIALSPTSLSFGNEKAGDSSSAKNVTVTNSSSTALSLTSITITGSQADDFTLTKTCGISLAAKSSCSISVTFKPVSTGSKTASISIADNASASPQAVPLSGTGT